MSLELGRRISVLTTPAGEQLAVLPLADYERLVAAAEETEDLALYDEAKRRFAAGEEEAIPAEFAKRLIAGESPIRVWREYRGLSQKDLAARADVSPAYLSQIESGAREGKIAAMRRLADALGVSLDDLAPA
jgi:DNA-binding XRE family transcriptional regulator